MPRKKAAPTSRISALKSKLPSKEQILNSEVNYFRGLSLLLIIMLVAIFFTFSALFGAMYVETKMMRQQLEGVYNQVIVEIDEVSDLVVEPEKDVVVEKKGDAYDVENWLSFEKYGFEVLFPDSWTFLDMPYVKQVHFFNDGVVRDDLKVAQGDFYVSVVDENVYEDMNPLKTFLVSEEYVGKIYIHSVDDINKNILVISVGDSYVNLYFSVKDNDGEVVISQELIASIIDNFKIIED